MEEIPSTSQIREISEGVAEPLEKRIERLERATAAIWSLLKSRTDLTDEQIIAEIREIEAAEVAHRNEGIACPACGRKLLSQVAQRCSWCGTAVRDLPDAWHHADGIEDAER
jgi:DNA-directed RNA polymerase subunit RPC12/RpoP